MDKKEFNKEMEKIQKEIAKYLAEKEESLSELTDLDITLSLFGRSENNTFSSSLIIKLSDEERSLRTEGTSGYQSKKINLSESLKSLKEKID